MGSFRDLFIKSDEQTEEQPTERQIPVTSFTGNMPSAMAKQQNAQENQTAVSSKASEALIGKIWETLLSKNFPGPDYLELKGHAQALEKFLPSYDQRLLAAFDVLKNQYHSFTTKTVIDSIDGYIKIVEDERKEGEEECARIYGGKLKEAQANFDKMQDDIAKLQQEIEEKSKLLSTFIEQKGTLQQELNNARTEMDQQVSTFTASVDAVLNVLESDKRTISNLKI
jgi:hypothetical protein